MLTDRQTRFVEEYLRAPSDAAGAALRAGYSPGRARRQARALLDMPEVRARIERERDAAVRPERIIRELARIAFADPADFFMTVPVGRGLAPGMGPEENGLPRQSADWFAMTDHPDPGGMLPPMPGASPRPTDDVGAAAPGASPRPTDDVGAAAPGAGPRPTDKAADPPPVGADAPGGPPLPSLPAGLRPGSGTGLKLKYTPKRGADGQTVFELSMEREVRVGDKLRALELLSKYLGLSVPPAAGGDGDDGDEPAGGLIVLPEIETEAEE